LKIADEIKALFHNELHRIDAICFVCNGSLERLTFEQESNIASMTEVFGENAAQCVSVLATFCDGGAVNVKNALEVSPSFSQIKDKIPLSK
jgi:hypothetical protein